MEVESFKTEPKSLVELIKKGRKKEVISALKRLGKLPPHFDRTPLILALESDSEEIRSLAIKNLGKFADISLLQLFERTVKIDHSSIVRREAVSSIGRMKSREGIPILLELLYDDNPAVVLQAIRGLLKFKQEQYVVDKLSDLKNHENEIVRQVVNHELKEKEDNRDRQIEPYYPTYLKNLVVNGDSWSVLSLVPDEAIHLTFTSPPYYNAKDYSIYKSYEGYLNFLELVFKEVYRVTKEGRFFLLNSSPVIVKRPSRSYSSRRYPIPYDIHPRLINMGWEFIDDIIWVKPEASVKNRNAGFLQHRKPLGYKPNAITENIMVYRKKTDKLIDWNMDKYPEDVIENSKVKGDYETTNVWEIGPTYDKTHSAVFPLELCNRVIQLYSYIGDLVLDPFAGSGTFGRSAMKLNRYFFLIEKDETFFKRIRELNEKLDIYSSLYQRPKYLCSVEFESFAKNNDTYNA